MHPPKRSYRAHHTHDTTETEQTKSILAAGCGALKQQIEEKQRTAEGHPVGPWGSNAGSANARAAT